MSPIYFSDWLRRLSLLLLFVLASIPIYMGVVAVRDEVRAYTALKADYAKVIAFLGEPIGQGKDKDGKDIAITRAAVLNDVVIQVLQNSQKQAAAAPAAPAAPAK